MRFLIFCSACSFGLPERSTDNSTGSVHRIHTRSVQRSHFGSSHFVIERALRFLASRAFLFSSFPSVYNPVFLCFPFALMACVDDGSSCQYHLFSLLLRIVASIVLALISTEWAITRVM